MYKTAFQEFDRRLARLLGLNEKQEAGGVGNAGRTTGKPKTTGRRKSATQGGANLF
jgi:hypothetical protein